MAAAGVLLDGLVEVRQHVEDDTRGLAPGERRAAHQVIHEFLVWGPTFEHPSIVRIKDGFRNKSAISGRGVAFLMRYGVPRASSSGMTSGVPATGQ